MENQQGWPGQSQANQDGSVNNVIDSNLPYAAGMQRNNNVDFQQAPAQADFNQPAPANYQPVQMQYEQQGIPAEIPSGKNGKALGVTSIIFGSMTLLFGIYTAPIGVTLGSLAISKGEKTLGFTGLILSIVLLVASIVLNLIYMDKHPIATGFLFFNFF